MKSLLLNQNCILAALFIVSGGAATGCQSVEEPWENAAEEEDIAITSQPLVSQTSANSFYDINNVVTIKITMPEATWTAARTAQPVGGSCNFDHLPSEGDRYSWFATTSVEISGTTFPASAKVYSGAEIKKKSFCGSASDTKPALKLKLDSRAETELGSRYLTLNNSVQDASFIRQALGYKLYRDAGLPAPRNNFVKVYVNGNLLEDAGVYVNVEPIREGLIQNPANGFAHTSGGNLYEMETDNLTADRLPYIDVESLSAYQDKKDLALAMTQISKGVDGMKSVIDVEQWIKIYAMEFLLKHWDGYARGKNNTYIYNDVAAVASPSVGNVKLKFIPWGLDQILKEDSMSGNGKYFYVAREANIAQLTVDDAALYAQFKAAVANLRESVFSRARLAGELKTFIDTLQAKLTSLGINRSAEIDRVRAQLALTRSAAYLINGMPTTSVYLRDQSTHDAMHASDVDLVPSSRTDYEVFHEAMKDDGSQRWLLQDQLMGWSIVSEKYASHKWLQFSSTQTTPAGHKWVMTSPSTASSGNRLFAAQIEWLGDGRLSGYVTWQNLANATYLRFGADDISSKNRKRVYQSSQADATKLYLY